MRTSTIFCGLLMLSMVGCDKNDVPIDQIEASIGFDLTVETKASVTTLKNIANFGIYAYHTGPSDWKSAGETATSEWVNHGRVNKSGNDWKPDRAYRWPNDDKLSFFSYSPYVTNLNGIIAPKQSPVVGVPEMGLELSRNAREQIDFLVATPIYDQTRMTNKGIVNLKYIHTTTRIGFKAFCLVPGITIDRIILTNLRYKGVIPLDENLNWKLEADSRDFSLDLNGLPISFDKDNPTDLSRTTGFFMLFPADLTLSSNTNIVAEITVNGREIKKSVPVAENWEMGKAIGYLLNLGGEQTENLIVERVDIEEWKLGDAAQDMDVENNGGRFTLAFDSNGGDGNKPSNLECQQGQMPKIENKYPVRIGFVFKGWNTNKDGSGEMYQPGERIKMVANTTLYGQWA